MSNLSTDILKELLTCTTPGPWTFNERITDTPSGTQEITHEVHAEGLQLFSICDDPTMNNYPLNLPFAAFTPELAQEVIRLRDHIEGLITAMEEKAATGQSVSPETIAGYLKDIVLKETG